MTGLLYRLHEKHIFRTALLYLGGAWAGMEAIGFFVDNYGWSRKILDVAVLLLVLGFPAALIIAWFHGERGRQQIQRTEASLLLTLAVLAAIGTYRLSTAEEIPVRSPGEMPSTVSAGVPDLGDRSVAVLPFVNNTGIDSLDWLGPGTSDMLTTNLAQKVDLRVVSPQRLFELLRLAGQEETDRIPQELAMNVASQSGAHTMVYGSILGAPDDLALDAQLIDLSDGTIIAAKRARGGDVFALADTVADAFAGRLAGSRGRVAVAPPAKPPAALTGNLGKLRQFQVELRSAWEKLETDSLDVRWKLVHMLEEVPGREEELRQVLEEIVTLVPEGEAEARAVSHLARVAITMGDTSAADSLIRRYSALESDEVQSLAESGQLLERARRIDEARVAYRKVLALEPGNRIALDRLARSYLHRDDPAGARAELETYLDSPDAGTRARAHLLIGDAHAWEGRFDAALRSYAAASEIGETGNRPDLRAEGIESALYLEWILDPQRGMSRLNRSIWRLIDLERGDKALNLVEAAERLYVKDADRLFPAEYHALLYAKGRVYELVGVPRAAAGAYSALMHNWGPVIGDLPLLADTPQRLARLRTEGPGAGDAQGRARPSGST